LQHSHPVSAKRRDRYLGTPADGVKAAFQEKGEKGV